jgi:[acyl-carrier-protein] S-malonyltransferase
MKSNVVGLFPGQGSQTVGMGLDLYEKTQIGRDYFQRADDALGFPISQICFDGPLEKLTETAIAQPAILLVSTISYELLKNEITLSAAIGHSLGEYSALVAAEAITFEEALVLVHKRGSYMQDAVPVGTGQMVAVLGKSLDEVEKKVALCTTGTVEVANVNAPGQIVVSGDVAGITSFKEAMKGSKIVDLTVSAPFHCSLMQKAAELLSHDLTQVKISAPKFPVYSNFYAQPLSESEEIKNALVLQVCGRVRFLECVENCVKELAPAAACEFGSGKVLSGLVKRINSDLPTFQSVDL